MMEAHAFEAVENNVFGTLNLALEAEGELSAISGQRSACLESELWVDLMPGGCPAFSLEPAETQFFEKLIIQIADR